MSEFRARELRAFLELWDVTRVAIHYRNGTTGAEEYIEIEPQELLAALLESARFQQIQSSVYWDEHAERHFAEQRNAT